MTDEPQPDLREQVAEALRTAPSALMDTEERARHAANPRNHHISHHYHWGCAVCRGEVDTLAAAVLAVVRPLLDAAQAELDAVAGRATAAITGMGADVRQARGERDRFRSAWLSARQRAEAYGEGILRHVEDRDTWKGWAQQQAARVVAAEAERDGLRAQLGFIHAVLDLAQRADFRGELIWHSDGATLTVSVDVSDVFAWGGSDAEDLTPERLPLLAQAVADLRAIHPSDDMYAVDLYAARLRGMRPQGAAYPKERAATQALFDACGPERPTGLGNPRKPPAPTEPS